MTVASRITEFVARRMGRRTGDVAPGPSRQLRAKPSYKLRRTLIRQLRNRKPARFAAHMRGLLLAASLFAARALPTRLRTRANAAETALADTKVDSDRFLHALQRLDADLEESERRQWRRS